MTRNVFYRDPARDYPVAMRGEGVYLYDANGNRYLDGSGGAAVSCLGHGHPQVIAAVKMQLDKIAYAHTAFFTNEPQEELARILAGRFGEPDARVYFLAGGSEANETAVKLARQYWVARGEKDKHIMISRRQSYHGNTLGALSLGGNPQRSAVYAPMLQDWPKIDPCYAYRHQRHDETAAAYGSRCAATLEEAIHDIGAGRIAAFFAETVVGATLGAVAAVPGYFRQIREICDRHDILLVLDEVMCGCGRTGTYFAFEQEGIVPDIVTVAKGLAGGYQPLGATIVRGFIHDQIVERHGSFTHGHTYVGHATACAAGVAVHDIVEQQGLLGLVGERGQALHGELVSALRDHGQVGDIRSRGLFAGIELVTDRQLKTPPASGRALAAAVKDTAMKNGLICYPGSGTADGRDGVHILLAPPFIVEQQHIDEIVTRLEATLAAVDIQ